MKTKSMAGWRFAWTFSLGALLLFLPISLQAQNRVNLRSNFGPAHHQGSRNTCSVFAATGLMEYLIRQQTGIQSDLSEAYNYWLGKNKALTSADLRRRYSDMDGLAGFLAVEAYGHGSMLESEWPYDNQHWLDKNDPRCIRRAGKATTRCYTGDKPRGAQSLCYGISPIYIPREDIGGFMLKYKNPVVINLLWNLGAINNKTGRVRMLTQEEIREAYGHVILLVGYNAGTRTFTFRNSHGPNFGDHGYGTIPEAYIVNHCELCPMLKRLGSANGEVAAFLRKASMGVSGNLIKLNQGAELSIPPSQPESIAIKFSEPTLVYIPEKSIVQISTAGTVVSSKEQWMTKKLRSGLYWIKKTYWKDFGWKINTATQKLYHGEHGHKDRINGEVTAIVGEEKNPERIVVRLSKMMIIFKPANGIFQLSAGGAVISYGDDWRIQRIAPKQYHMARNNWSGFYWLVDAEKGRLYTVTEGQFGRRGGRRQMTTALLEVKP